MPTATGNTPKIKLSASKLKNTTKVPKLDTILEKKEEEEVEKAKLKEPEEQYGLDPFTYDQLKTHWDDFASQKKSAGRDIHHAVLKEEMQLLDDGYTILLKLTNAVNIDTLDIFRSDLITYLKSKLNNRSIRLETEVIKEADKRMIYTNKDKFDYLLEKKPILHSLKDRLGLDPDF